MNENEKKVLDYVTNKAGIAISDENKKFVSYSDFGINEEYTGMGEILYVNTKRVCAKDMVLFPFYTCPEHMHPATELDIGKEETFKCRFGTVYLYVDGKETPFRAVEPPKGTYTVFHEVILKPGDQYTLEPGIKHWFRAGSEGAVISEFSTHCHGETDVFSDRRIVPTGYTEQEV